MEIIPLLPPFQALMNVTATCLMLVAYLFIRKKNRRAHRRCMLAALTVSAVFLCSYLYYHSQVGNVQFTGQGAVRPVYFTILFTHVLLAALIVPLILVTVTHALREQLDRHRRIARITLPLWLYVSITGVAIYIMAFHLYPPSLHVG